MNNTDFIEEYKNIGGIEQYLLHYPVKNAPVLLFLHGGPGSVESNFSYLFRQWWGDMFTIVQWDQRGSGKTLHKNPDTSKYPLTVETILSDVGEVVNYVKEKYGQEKIVLMGHSWGTYLSILYLQKHAENVSLYIGVGQVVNTEKNEKIGLAKAMELAEKAEDTKDIKKLQSVGEYPPQKLDKEGFNKVVTVRKVQQKYGLAVGLDASLVKKFIKSPVFRVSDITTMLFKTNKVNIPLASELMNCDFDEQITEISVPVCLIQGENDYQTVTSLAVEFIEGIEAPDKQIHILKNAGHNTMVDQPELFTKTLAEAKTMMN